MEAIIRQAEESDYEVVQAFYDQLSDDMEKEPYHPCWQKGVYPDEAYLRASIGAGELWLAEVQGQIASSMVVNAHANAGYLQGEWKVDARPGEYGVIHTLGVGTVYRRRGIGRQMLRHALGLSAAAGYKAVRLDLIDHNLPAAPVYTRMGFRACGSVRLFYDAVGWQTFHLYEYVL